MSPESPEDLYGQLQSIERSQTDLEASQAKGCTFRVCICALAVLLIWISSLTVCYTVVSGAISSPTVSEVASRWVHLQNVVHAESNYNSMCIESAYATALHATLAVRNTSLDVLHVAAERRSNAVEAAARDALKCDLSLQRTRIALVAYQRQDRELVFRPSCSTSDKSDIRDLLFSSVFDRPSKASEDPDPEPVPTPTKPDYWGRLGQEVDATIRERLAYDREYMTNKSEVFRSTVDAVYQQMDRARDEVMSNAAKIFQTFHVPQLQDCFGLAETCPDPRFRDAITTAFADMKMQAEKLYNDINHAYNQIQLFQILISDMLADVQWFFDTLNSLPDFDFLGVFGSRVFPNLSFEPLEFRRPQLDLPTLESIRAALSAPTADLLNPVGKLFERVNLTIDTSLTHRLLPRVRNLTVSLPTILEDYNPPALRINVSTYKAEEQAYELSIKELEKEETPDDDETPHQVDDESIIKAITQNANNDQILPPPDSDDIDHRQPQISMEVDFRMPHLTSAPSFGPLAYVITVLSTVVLCLDIIYRAIKSVRTIARHLRGTAVSLPIVDVSKQSISADEALQSSSSTACTTITACLSGPILAVIVLITFLSIFLWLIALLYLAMYSGYVNGCVNSSGGTFIARNTARFAMHMAAAPGDSLRHMREGEISLAQSTYCNNIALKEAYGSYTGSVQHARSISALEKSIVASDLLQRCVAFESMFAADETVKVDDFHLKVTDIVADLVTTCRLSVYDEDLFDYGEVSSSCWSSMPSSSFSCGGSISSASISASSHAAACESEWFFHSVLARMAGCIIFYVCLNFSRRLLLDSITALFWRWSGEKRVVFMANCDLDGNILPDSQDLVRAELQSTLRRRRLLGFTKLLLSLVVFAPGIFSVIYMAQIKAPLR